ncbi:MAG: glycosyltransferase family 39 protein [bacterium]
MKKLSVFFVFVIFILFFNGLNNSFIFDDTSLTVENSVVTEGSFVDVLTAYRPVRTFSYWLDYHLFGSSPWGFRLMNIFYHIMTTLGLLALFRVMGMSRRASFFGVLLFASHPIHCDAVTYISGRRDVLSGMFFVFSLLYFIKYYRFRKHSDKPSTRWMIFALLFMFLSYFSKETGATIPLIWLLYVLFHDGKKVLETRWFYLMSMGVLGTVSILALYTIQEGASSLISFSSINFHGENPVTHYLTALTLPVYYIKQTIFPLQLRIDNINYELVSSAASLRLWFSISGIAVYFGIVFMLIRKNIKNGGSQKPLSPLSLSAFFMIFFMLTLLPMLQIVPLHEIVAEHYLYLPSAAFCGIAGIAAGRAWKYVFTEKSKVYPLWVPPVLLTLFFSTAVFFSWRTVTRNMEMKNWWTLLHAEQKWGELSYRGYYTLAGEYFALRFPESGKKLLDKSLEKEFYDENSYTNLMRYHFMKGNPEAAAEVFEKALKEKNFGRASFMIDGATAHFLTGRCSRVHSIIKKTRPERISHRKEIAFLEICPKNPRELVSETCTDTASPLFCEADARKNSSKLIAFQLLQEHLRQNPMDRDALLMKAELLSQLGKLRVGAIPVYRKLIENFTWPEKRKHKIMSKYAMLLMKTDIPEAAKLYKKIEKEFPENKKTSQIVKILEKYQKDILLDKKHYRLDI